MKKLLAFCAVFVCTFSVLGQTNGASMIKSVYGENHYNEMVSTNPGQIELLEKYAVHGFHIVDAEDKYNAFPELNEISLRAKSNSTITIQSFLQIYNSGSFNPLNYGFFPGAETQIFRLQGTDFVIVIDNQSSILAH